ncbi:thioredoxin-related protein [Pedobacter africanus]|uniref:Thioredoxin-related protein n=1 Tax=Pedobacter africanus TaxID=151894 RepID=A0ACC6L501_9SPHI|nr:DUF255 domain-containing protein [Pedobacter africanus]MDR6786457.1 thioredoxin-related protein [Pedobacter africanus]
MKKTLMSLAFLSLASHSFAQENGIRFEQRLSWQQIKDQAKEQNKYIFIDVFATWCVPCKAMDQEIYPSEKLGAYMNDKFISVKIQADSTNIDTEFVKSWYLDARKIIAESNLKGYPSYLFFSPEGKLLHQGANYKTVGEFLELAGQSLDPEKQYYTQLKKFMENKMDYSKMHELILLAKTLGKTENAQMVADVYINGYLLKLDQRNLFTKDNLDLIGGSLKDSNSESFKLFMSQSEMINQVLGPFQAQNTIMNFINKSELPQNVEASKKADWDKLEKKLTNKYGSLGQEIVWGQRMIYHLLAGDNWSDFGKYYVLYFNKALKHPRRYKINDMCWVIFENIEDPNILRFAVEVMEYDIETYDQNNAAAYDTYANLLYKTGKKKNAIEWEEKAVKVKRGQADEEVYIEILGKMKAGLPTWEVKSIK